MDWRRLANPSERWLENNQQLIAVSGEMGAAGFGVAISAQNVSVQPFEFGVPTAYSAQTAETAYVYTERPLYRPGDTVYIRGWLRDTDYARHSVTSRDSVNISFNSPDFERTPESLIDVAVDENGNFSAKLVLPEDAPLGAWQLSLF